MCNRTTNDDVIVFDADTVQPGNPGRVHHRLFYRAPALLNIQQKIGSATEYPGGAVIMLQPPNRFLNRVRCMIVFPANSDFVIPLIEKSIPLLVNPTPEPRCPLGTTGTDGLFIQVWYPAFVHDHPATRNGRAHRCETQSEKKMPIESIGIQRCERQVVGNHDVGQLPRRQCTAWFFEHPVRYAAVALQ